MLEHFKRVKANALALVTPHLVAIYQEATLPRVKTEQVGAGFLIKHKHRPVLITAKHTLYGHDGNEDPWAKAIFVTGFLKMLGHLKSRELAQAE